MHPEADAFLDAIFDNPAEDTPRLVYADWLQEHGQENYAQFIRLQCAAAREKLWSAEANRLWEEIGRVWNRLDEEWWPATRDVWELPGVQSVWDWRVNAYVDRAGPHPGLLDAIHFRRGLLRPDIPLTCDQAIRYSPFWPSIMSPDASLTLDGPPGVLIDIASNTILRHVRHVRCVTDIYDDNGYPRFSHAVSQFLHSPHLCRARVLDLTEVFLDGNAIESLLCVDRLPRVEELRLRNFFCTSPGGEETLIELKKRFNRVVHD